MPSKGPTEWIIVVWDNIPKRWPAAEKLVETGVPLKIAYRYKRVRREMTAGLKRRVRGNVN